MAKGDWWFSTSVGRRISWVPGFAHAMMPADMLASRAADERLVIEGHDPAAVASSWSGATAVVVRDALSGIVRAGTHTSGGPVRV